MTQEIEIPFRWKCPKCGHVQSDTVNPDLGPYLNVICHDCQHVTEQQEMDSESADNWERAMRNASEPVRVMNVGTC